MSAQLQPERLALRFEGGLVVLCQLLMLEGGCCHVWLGSPETGVAMNNLALSIQTRFEPRPLTRMILPAAGGDDVGHEVSSDDWATAVSRRMAKRLKMQVLVSCNLPASADFSELLDGIEQRLVAHIEEKRLSFATAAAAAVAAEVPPVAVAATTTPSATATTAN